MNESATLTRAQWTVLAAAFLGWMFDGVEIGLFPLIVRPALQDLGLTGDAEIAKWNSVVVACFLLGAAGGGLLFGWCGDKFGRVRSMVVAVLVYSLFTGACYFATSPWELGMFRFMASMGMGGEWALAVALVMECWPERHRPLLAGAIGAAANLGTLFIAVVALAKPVTRDAWRWIMLVGAVPALLALLISLLVPESEKWKASVRRGVARPIREIFSPALRKRTLLAIVFSAIPLIGTWAAVAGWIPVWVDQMTEADAARGYLDPAQAARFDGAATPREKHELLRECLSTSQWQEVGHRSARAKAAVQCTEAVGAILACFAASLLGGRWGRRPVYFGLCLLSLLCCTYLFRCVGRFDWYFLLVAFVVGAVTATFYGWLPLYLPELFPTRVRATGQGLSFNFGRILAALGTLYMGRLVAMFGNDYGQAMSAITLVYVAGMVLIWFGPETQGRPLPE